MVKPGYKQTAVGVIPEDWDIVPLRDISAGKFTYGVNAPAVEYMPPLPNYIRITDISDDGCFIRENRASVVCGHPEQFTLKENDIVFARTGASTGKTYLYRREDGELVYAGFLIKASIDPSRADSRYVFASLHTRNYWNWVATTSMRSGQPGINGNEYASYQIAMPELAEQTCIAEALEDTDMLMTSLEKLISKKKAIKQGAMQELLTGKKRLPGFSGEITHKPLKSLCTVFADGDWIESKDQSSDGIRLIQTGNVGNGRYIDKQDKQRFISKATFERLHCLEIFEGDVLISRLPEPAGRACILPASSKRRITAVDCTVVRFSSYNPVLFVAYSQTRQYQEKVDMAMAGSTRQRISRKELGEIPVPVFPTIDEQNAVAAIFAHMDGEIVALEQKLEKYRQVKQGMMQQLLTGKIRLV